MAGGEISNDPNDAKMGKITKLRVLPCVSAICTGYGIISPCKEESFLSVSNFDWQGEAIGKSSPLMM